MTYLLKDDNASEDPKVVVLSDLAYRVYDRSLHYCARHLTDGLVPGAVFDQFSGSKRTSIEKELTTTLIPDERPLMVRDGDHFLIPNYLKWNPSREQVLSKRESKRMAGAKGAASRWHTPSHGGGNAPQPQPIPQPKKRTSKALSTEGGRSSDFDEFWATYPRREGKGKARTAYVRALKKSDPETILLGAERYRDDPNRDPAFTAHPTSWLNAERWTDEPLPPRGSAAAPTRTEQLMAKAVAALPPAPREEARSIAGS